jgi:hypothetical protein
MNYSEILSYYSREDVQSALLSVARDREVAGVFMNGSFSARPGTLVYPDDIIAMVKKGVVEFHCSLEHWSRPMALKSEDAQGYDSLRKGWDLILDIDCEDTEHGKIATKVLLWALEKHNIKNVSIKFTGGTGFHVGIPWSSIPDNIDYRPAATMYPELARQMGLYLRGYMKEELEKKLLKRYMPAQLAEQVGIPLGDVLKGDDFNPFKIVDIDPILISPRHLFRMPYSLHRGTGLVSKPVLEEHIDDFKREHARPETTRALKGFLGNGGLGKGSESPVEAEFLITETVEWAARQKKKETKTTARRTPLRDAVPIEMAPPCIKNILAGMPDGKKRALFILVNYLSSLKWRWENIESVIKKWNEKNIPPLPISYLRGHFRWHRAQSENKPPPNCNKEGWMIGIGVCKPDTLCGGQKRSIKNPVSYPLKKMKPVYKARKKKRTQGPRQPDYPREPKQPRGDRPAQPARG